MIGKSIAHYHITEKLGSGGMGEVYRAHDTKLGRDVALKVLPDLFAQDPERMARFEREAKLLASLNHPNIAAIYGLEESESPQPERSAERTVKRVRCLVLELVEGETLAARLEKGAIPREEALQIALQMARALESAHEKDIIHRDLKPANVSITPDGTVKVLDFGLAKALADESGTPDDLSQAPTLSPTATRAGVIMGTAAYMSPEQAKGKKVDRRADIWGFGILLLEMLTGKRTYRGETLSETMAAVMMIEPDWDALPPETPEVLRRFLKRCLRKDPMSRLRDIGDARIQIEEMLAEPEASASVAETSALDVRAVRRAKLSWALAGVMTLVALGALLGLWQATRPVEQPSARFNITLSPREVLFENSGAVADLSPDGTRLVYVGGSISTGATGQGRKLYIRSMNQLDATPLSGTEDAFQPFFSPDGQWVAFFSSGKLKKVSVYGGAPKTLCDAPSPRGGSWGPDDTIVFAPTNAAGLSRVPAAGGTPQELTAPGEGERSHRWPHVLPDGKAVLFITQASGGGHGGNYDDATIEVLSLATGERKVVHEGGSLPRYLPTGHLVYVREGTLFAAPFDRDRLETTGPPAPIIESVVSAGTSDGDGGAQFAFSETGTLVYLSGALQAENYKLVWVDGEGAVSTLAEQQAHYTTPRLSPDGRRLAVTLGGGLGGEADVWVYEIERGAMTRLTFEPGYDAFPVWSADGERLAFVSSRDGSGDNLFWKSADGTGEAERLTESQNRQFLTSWSPDGKVLAFSELDPETGWDIWMLPLDGDREPQLFHRTPFLEIYPEFSPDGRWLAYISDESGRAEVYVKPFPGPGGKWQISTDGGWYPLWGPDGGELFYRNLGGDRMLVVPYTVDGESFRAGRPRELFQGQFASRLTPDVDIAPDGKRFVMLQSEGAAEAETEPTKLIFVLNWFDEINRLVPAGN